MFKRELIIGERETGKTTYLFNKIISGVSKNEKVVILDSATEHTEKSLLKKVEKKIENTISIKPINEKDIVLDKLNFNEYIKNYQDYFPYRQISSIQSQIIGFDLSYFLEKGHEEYEENNNKKEYIRLRNMYNFLSQQIIISLLLSERALKIKNGIIFMDEIELPIINYNFSKIKSGISIFATVHPENAFGSFYKTFDKKTLVYKPEKG